MICYLTEFICTTVSAELTLLPYSQPTPLLGRCTMATEHTHRGQIEGKPLFLILF